MHTRDRLPDWGTRPVIADEGTATLAAGTAAPPGARTSDDHPFEVTWVPLPGTPGRLGIAMAPGRHDRTGEGLWWRDLHTDLRQLRHVHRARTVVTLLTESEQHDLGIGDLHDALLDHGFEHLTLPTRDGSVPQAAQEDAAMALLHKVVRRLADGHTVVLHCRAGQGRSGMWAAMVAAVLGEPASAAVLRVRAVQPRAVETVAQEAYVADTAVAWARRRLAER